MDLDRKFCKDSTKDGAKGWVKYFWEDAYMVTGEHIENIQGLQNIEKAMEGLFALEDLVFIWEPMKCELSDDKTMGYTMGKYTRTFKREGKEYVQKGKYTTIWKKKGDIWKITMDTGN